jgi:DNA-binding transcriptional regulator YdaS (Cro superfamily)
MPRAKVNQSTTAPALRKIRRTHGLQSALARHLGVTRQAISDWTAVPITRLKDVEKFTGIPREKLRPDIFG